MFVLMGNREKTKSQACICAPCFESVMSGLSDEFHGMKEMAHPPVKEEPEAPAPLDGPRCFGCGLAPEKCRCAWEAYR